MISPAEGARRVSKDSSGQYSWEPNGQSGHPLEGLKQSMIFAPDNEYNLEIFWCLRRYLHEFDNLM